MKINIKNKEKINKELLKANKGCSVRTVSYNSLIMVCEDIEKQLSEILNKKDRSGLKFQINLGASTFSASYNGNPTSTYFTVERGSSSWFLISASRMRCGSVRIYPISFELKKSALASFQENHKNWN